MKRCLVLLVVMVSMASPLPLLPPSSAAGDPAGTEAEAAASGTPDSLPNAMAQAPKVYIDCPYCYLYFLRMFVGFVNHVRERLEADVHVLVTTQATATGGTEYTLTFIGQHRYAGLQDTLLFASRKEATEDGARTRIARTLKLGLARYAAHSPIADRLSIDFEGTEEREKVIDRWNNWVFGIDVNSYLNGEKSYKYIYGYGRLWANRITVLWKHRYSVSTSYNESKYGSGSEAIESISRGSYGNGLTVRSITEHLSVGGYISLSTSTYSNTRWSAGLFPAAEWDLFPYSESTRRQLRVLYNVGVRRTEYVEETLYDKTAETLGVEELSATLVQKQPWGSVDVTAGGSHYFHDPAKYRLELYGSVSLNLFRGLSLKLNGSGSRIHDQISLPKGEATQEELLLRRSQLATSYQYSGSLGLSYTFGSIYSNIVNPRFGN